MTTQPKRYALVQSDSGGDWYVIEADRRDEWYSTVTDEQIDAGLPWAHPVGGAESQVTFTDPEIFEVPVEDVTGMTAEHVKQPMPIRSDRPSIQSLVRAERDLATVVQVPPGPCPSVQRGLFERNWRCDLRAGHAGDHTHQSDEGYGRWSA